MEGDEKFELSDDQPLKLKAVDTEDLKVISTFLQDSIFTRKDFKYDPLRRELSLLFNRVRWELYNHSNRASDGVERVRSLLMIHDVLECENNLAEEGKVQVPLSLLNIDFESSIEGTGKLNLNLSGYWNIQAKVECINIYMNDVTQPYVAPSKKYPKHPE
ncbi:MAG: DUF2948 family protein [Rhodobacteraceae bacterium]|nr:DUF2948 family protein [Paracoccaceae bacterium]